MERKKMTKGRFVREGNPPKCSKCGTTIFPNQYFFKSAVSRIRYCERCYETIWFDLEDSNDLVWIYDPERDLWILQEKPSVD